MTSFDSKPFRIVLLGPPASGKGTQGRRLASYLGLDYLSTGALLREQVEHGTALGLAAAPLLERGEYLPDELMCSILERWLEDHPDGWVLDGFPRSEHQALFLDGWISKNGRSLDAAISLEVPFDELLSRVDQRVECPACRWTGQRVQRVGAGLCPQCGAVAARRADDGEQNFRSRYREFEKLTLPVIHHYRKMGILVTCEAAAPQDEVAARLAAHFDLPASV